MTGEPALRDDGDGTTSIGLMSRLMRLSPAAKLLLVAAPLGLGVVALSQTGRPGPDASERAEQLAKLDPEWQRLNGCGPGTEGSAKAMPLLAGLAPVHYPVATRVPLAQRFFDQGLAFLYGFEYNKAERSFEAAQARDPRCAMCFWGQALAKGPNINSGVVPPAEVAAALRLVNRGLAVPGLEPRERALLEALRVRYQPNPPKGEAGNHGVHAIAYAEAMGRLARRYPADDVITVLAGEAAMDVRPWDYWVDAGRTPRPWAARAVKHVETVLARNPDQPQAQHLYIHLTEGSADPKRAERSADKLAGAAPASAHLVHMPSHTWYRIGRHAESLKANLAAVRADDAMARRLGEYNPFYGYWKHHHHFAVSSAEQIGDEANALQAAKALEDSTPPEGFGELLRMTAMAARAQFGTRDEVLRIPAPLPKAVLLRSAWRAFRAEALARAGDGRGARRELAALATETRRGLRPEARPVLRIAELSARGRLAMAEGKPGEAARLFGEAERIQAGFGYNEPPVWHQPVASSVGAALLAGGDAAGARAAFGRALAMRPGNAWALWGRVEAERRAGDRVAAARSLGEFERIWAGGDARPRLDRL